MRRLLQRPQKTSFYVFSLSKFVAYFQCWNMPAFHDYNSGSFCYVVTKRQHSLFLQQFLKTEPRHIHLQVPPLSTKVLSVRFDPPDQKLPADNHKSKHSFISYQIDKQWVWVFGSTIWSLKLIFWSVIRDYHAGMTETSRESLKKAKKASNYQLNSYFA